MKLKELKNGEYFTLKPYANPKDTQVWVKEEYDRSTKKYVCTKFCDFCESRLIDGNKEIYTDFIF